MVIRASLRNPGSTELFCCRQTNKLFASLAVISDDLAPIYGLCFGFMGTKDILSVCLVLVTYKRDAGSKQQNSDKQILKLLNDQLPEGLSCKRLDEIVIAKFKKHVCEHLFQLDNVTNGPLDGGPKS